MQDVNRQVYWSHATEAALLPRPVAALSWDGAVRALTLRPSAALPPGGGTVAEAVARAALPRLALDALGTWARADAARTTVLAGGAGEPETVLWQADPGETVADLDWAEPGHLLIAVAGPAGTGRLVWLDMLARFDPVSLAEPGFAPDRIAAAPGGGPVWLVDRARAALRLLAGVPIPDVLDTLAATADRFAPRPEMADPPRLDRPALATVAGEPILDACADVQGALVLLRHAVAPAGEAILDRLDATGARARRRLPGVVAAFTLAPLADGRVALAVPGWPEARAFDLPPLEHPVLGGPAEAVPGLPDAARYPLRGWTGGRLVGGAAGRPSYPVAAGAVRRLAALSFAAHATQAATVLAVIDGGAEAFVWHRVYLDAELPEGCAIAVEAAAAETAAELDAGGDGAAVAVPWHPHRFGAAAVPGVPQGAWIDAASERPWAGSPVACPRRRDRAGLFAVLLQRGDGAENRRLAGRFLRLRLTLTGTGAATPRLFALRVWGPRFSWRDRYLPELYRIEEGPGAAGSDFLDRYLALFESVLTPIEGEIAAVWRLANPGTIPAEGLDWLAGWLGLRPDGALGEAGTRRLIAEAARLAPWRGTLRGLTGMLDIATDGGIAAGRIVVVEHFRMRRTFATVLGSNVPVEFDPLTRRPVSGPQSSLGPAFFLGAEDEKRLFALFRPELLDHPLTTAAERAQAAAQLGALFDDAAHRVSVLVHDETDPDRRALIARVIARETPAHVIADMRDAPASLILGLSALLGVETRTGPAPEIPPMKLGQTRIGQGRLRGTPSLDQRL